MTDCFVICGLLDSFMPPFLRCFSGLSLLHEIDASTSLFCSEAWQATLSFKGFLCKSNSKVPPNEYVLQDLDLFELTKPIHLEIVCRFDPDLYPVVPGGFHKNGDVFNKLVTDLMAVSHQNHNCRLTNQGASRSGDAYAKRYLKCMNHRCYQITPKVGGDLRKSSITRDKKIHGGERANGCQEEQARASPPAMPSLVR